jgi:hypothetical protein
VRLLLGATLVLVIAGSIRVGVRKIRSWSEAAMDDEVTRPYQAPSRLIIAAVRSDYASDVIAGGAIILRHLPPAGPAAGLAAWYGGTSFSAAEVVDDAIASMNERPTYRPLAAPSEPCRSDAESSVTTLGQLSFGDDEDVTLWTCTLTKKDNVYFLAWAAPSSSAATDEPRLMRMLKRSQLVSNNLCSVNVINGGCSASAAQLVAALVTHARR